MEIKLMLGFFFLAAKLMLIWNSEYASCMCQGAAVAKRKLVENLNLCRKWGNVRIHLFAFFLNSFKAWIIYMLVFVPCRRTFQCISSLHRSLIRTVERIWGRRGWYDRAGDDCGLKSLIRSHLPPFRSSKHAQYYSRQRYIQCCSDILPTTYSTGEQKICDLLCCSSKYKFNFV
jgi:hypothetical protein